ncbi:LamG-like jellyroll fold domain-containing protein [Formosa sp. 4Alg 33]|uniref:LamG-like jellyroll fold domain-containing protein n=1 Tax=Formosa sp. 4Alg 33 TaxID=3382189 RepID=UPI003D9C2C3F
MKKNKLNFKLLSKSCLFSGLITMCTTLSAQTLAFPEATGFGRYTTGARGAENAEIYLVTNLNDSGPGSFRDGVSQEGRFIIFKVGGIINLQSQIVVSKNTTIAGQTATGEGIVLAGPRVSFTGASNTIARYVRIRYVGGAQNQDASGISNGRDIILDHMTFSWGTDEVFSVNWDNKGESPDNITIQNSIIGQGLHRHNHSAGGLMQPSDGKLSIIGNLYLSNKTRNPKVKGINEFVNNVVYNWGNYGNTYGHTESGDAYIMGGDSEGISKVNIINNYFIGGPHTSNTVSTPFNRGNSNFFLYGSGNYFDNNKNGILDGELVSEDLTGYPTGDDLSLQATPYDYPEKNATLSAQDAFDKAVLDVGASYPKRDQVDSLMIANLKSKGTEAFYVYREYDLPFINGGLGHVYGAPAPLDSDNDGMPDAWEDANGLDRNTPDALAESTLQPPYLNIEVYINGITNETPPDFIYPPSDITFTEIVSTETPPSAALTVNWGDNATNEDQYVVERSDNGTDFIVISTLDANTISYTDTGLTPNTTYYYRVKAINSTEFSVYNTIASVTTQRIPSTPDKANSPIPTSGFNNTELLNGQLNLKWNGSDNTLNYAVYLGTDSENLNKLADITYSETPSYQVSELTPGANYYWRVDAINDKGTTPGEVWTFKVLTPEHLGHWPFKEVAGEGMQIADVSRYENHGKLDPDFDNAEVRVAGKTNQAIDFATSLDSKYMVNIPNQNQLLFDNSSFTISFWMKADPSLLPQSSSESMYILCKGSFTKNETTGATGKRFNVEVKGDVLRFAIDDNATKKELSTTAANFFTGAWVNVVIMRDIPAHKLRIYTNGIFTAELDETAVTGISEASDLIIGNIGVFELAAGTAPAPYKGLFDELEIFNYALTEREVAQLYANTLSINETFHTDSNRINIYPNPAKNHIFIHTANTNLNGATATLFDMTGKVILKEKLFSKTHSTYMLDVSQTHTSGIYILNISGDHIHTKFKIVVE